MVALVLLLILVAASLKVLREYERGVISILDAQTDSWGIKVSNVELKHVDLNESMIRAIARQAEAERERRAKVINAEGEFQAAGKLLDAARIIARQPEALQLRYLQTLLDMSAGSTSTVVFPLPVDLLSAASQMMRSKSAGDSSTGDA